tara:strand:- start:383 stop:580 length:198 start_codon:yes stop_codon:yes gene_type:complete
VRLDYTNKAKPLAQKQNNIDFFVSQATGIAALLLILSHALILFSILIVFSTLGLVVKETTKRVHR